MIPMHATCPYLFVYGSLRPGASNAHARALARQARLVGKGKVQGRLYRVNWYPGMVLSTSPQDTVCGEVYQLRDPDALLALLDEYEGCGAAGASEFVRILGTVRLDGGAPLQCWLYVYQGQPEQDRRIRSADGWQPRPR
jgi:gamma-glutamylcyclotransferase (GGCT)/AIG2-like uncharacterized protein YtfP